ncbi:MAG: lysophospholipid acyltransferase family protein [Proteobacteria bacterium]|nr:lysophospholipid acyltransferase family protein [Pseudomonadota bacterium]
MMGTLLKGVAATMRIRLEGMERLDSMQVSGQLGVLAFFHGRMFLLMTSLRGRKVAGMVSLSRDGDAQARTMRSFGYEVARGSASRGGVRGLIGLRRLMRQGYWPTLAVDGPKGPIHEVKPGAVYLAKKEKIPILPMTASASPCRILRKAWDHHLIPLPSSRGAVVIGEPVYFDDDMKEEAIARDCGIMRDVLLGLQARADGMVGLRMED